MAQPTSHRGLARVLDTLLLSDGFTVPEVLQHVKELDLDEPGVPPFLHTLYSTTHGGEWSGTQLAIRPLKQDSKQTRSHK